MFPLTRAKRRSASSSCVGRPGTPGPSTDCSVTDGLRWIVDHHTVGCCDQPKRPASAITAARPCAVVPASERIASARRANSRWRIRCSVPRGISPGPYTPRPRRRTLPRPHSHRNASDTDLLAGSSAANPWKASASTSSRMVERPCLAKRIVRTYRNSTPRSVFIDATWHVHPTSPQNSLRGGHDGTWPDSVTHVTDETSAAAPINPASPPRAAGTTCRPRMKLSPA
jgi:hypothetical protein